MRPSRMTLRAAALVLLAALAACSGSEAPSDHTVSMDGVKHKPGLQDPMTSCTACHGASLQGGDGPSCTSCHGDLWNR